MFDGVIEAAGWEQVLELMELPILGPGRAIVSGEYDLV